MRLKTLHVQTEMVLSVGVDRIWLDGQHNVHNVNLRLELQVSPERFKGSASTTNLPRWSNYVISLRQGRRLTLGAIKGWLRCTESRQSSRSSYRLGSNYQLPFWAVRGDVKLLRQLSSILNFYIWRLPSHFPTFTSTYTLSRWRFYFPKFCQICEETKSESQRFYSCQSVFIKILNYILISYKSLNHLVLNYFQRQDVTKDISMLGVTALDQKKLMIYKTIFQSECLNDEQ